MILPHPHPQPARIPMPVARFSHRLRFLLSAASTACAAWACLAGCQSHESDLDSLSPRGGGSETTVVGRVLDDSGRGVAGAAVWMRNEEDSPLDQGGNDSGSAGEALAYSDEDGKYRIEGVHTGLRYLIECRRGEGKAAAVSADAADLDTVHAPDAVLRPTGTLRGRVLLPESSFAGTLTTPAYVYIPGLWQRTVTGMDDPAFEIRDVPAGTYSLRAQPAYTNPLATLGILELNGITIESGDTTDVGDVYFPMRAATTASEAYARDSAAAADFRIDQEYPIPVADYSAVLGNRIILLYDLSGGFLAGISDRVRELDALELVSFNGFRVSRDSLNPDGPAIPISPALSELPHLRQLWLPYVHASDLPRWTGSFPALTSLNLSNVGLYSIPDWVLERKRLTYLGLGANGLEAVPDALARLRGLRVLDLSENRLDALPPILMKMKSLQGVNLRRNRICSLAQVERDWIAHQDSLWIRQRDPLDTRPDTLSWEATQDCGNQ
jgi:hypothetical protein